MKLDLKNLFKKKQKASLPDLMGDGIQPHMKEGKSPSTGDFIGDFKPRKATLSPEQLAFIDVKNFVTGATSMSDPYKIEVSPQKKMKLTKENKHLVRNSILISLDFPVSRLDLEFIDNSKIDGKPIYRYCGQDFSSFNLPYEEIFSLNQAVAKISNYQSLYE